jgi:hypothetical protein
MKRFFWILALLSSFTQAQVFQGGLITQGGIGVGGSPGNPPGSYDMLSLMLMSPSLRAVDHFAGTKLNLSASNHLYTQPQTTNFYWTKGDTGFPWDIQLVDANYIYLSTTELTYANASEGKRFESTNGVIGFKGVPFAARFMNIGQSVLSSDTRFAQYSSVCGSVTYSNLGLVKVTLTGPFVETISGAGSNLPSNLNTVHLEYEWDLASGYAHQAASVKETFTFDAAGVYGLVAWQTQDWNTGTGSYDPPTDFTHYNILTSGTSGIPFSDPCNFGINDQDQTRVIQNDSPTPNMGGLTGTGTIVTPHDFGNPIVRATDSVSGGGYSWSGTGVFTGNYTVTPTGADYTSIWNSDSTFLLASFSGAGYTGVLGFNPSTMTPAAALVPGFQVAGPSMTWSRTNNKLLYHLVSGTGNIETYTFTDATHAPTANGSLYDFKNCTGSGITAGNVTWQGDLGIDALGNIGTTVSITGTQDTATLVVAYNISSGLCQVLHANTGLITGSGVTGATSISDEYLVHDTNLGAGGWVAIAAATGTLISNGCHSLSNTNQQYYWQLGTTTVTCSDSSTNGGGHNVAGYAKFWNTDSFPTAYIRNYATPSTRAAWGGTEPTPCCSAVANAHQSWSNPGSGDTGVVTTSTSSSGLGASPTFTTPLVNEIYQQTMDGTNAWKREFHCYIDDSNANFYDNECISSVSQDGRFVAWTSDWLETLGTPHRIDIFIGKLQ